jgi:glycosyltransferase involved in cell wall biosynthesis
MVIDALGKGGKERRMLEIIKGLKAEKNKCEITLVSLTDLVGYDYVYDLPINFIVLKRNSKLDFSIIWKLRAIIKDFKPDIIHSWSTMASVYLVLAKAGTKIPFINGFIADAPAVVNVYDKYYWRVKFTTPFSDAFVANSLAGIKAYKTPSGRTFCINNGIDFSRFENLRERKEVEFEILSEEKMNHFLVTMVATFSNKKDYKTLVDAAIELCREDPDFVFVLIGDGPTKASLQCKVNEAGLADRILFPGKRSDVESILQISDIGALMTYTEGLSNAIIEYMAMGLPVIASRGGGTDELIEDGFNGYMVDTESKDQLKDRIVQLKNDKKLYKNIAQNAYRWVREQFDIAKKTAEYEKLYYSLIKKKQHFSIEKKVRHTVSELH